MKIANVKIVLAILVYVRKATNVLVLKNKQMSNRTKEEIAKDIKFVLEDKVAPAVAQHNGFINYLDILHM